ncbi:hypothetical protein K470DRAFT_257785 [Piedraia hortae CBS 480.64]|uniref:P-loop containing nucleoside triphosphate hydrolase protein n=1 Tax=Piedraia hortae CBS 480.64 TaxID=1314780 RepID=A0A6A7C1H5_9PEZI|nr:hypothetical protein K470DRAFT_257785 [Piedraia hortae CBS 480.64]
MVRERSPSNTSLSPRKQQRQPLASITSQVPSKNGAQEVDPSGKNAVESGKPSSLRHPLKKPEPSVFIPRPKPIQPASANRPIGTSSVHPAPSQILPGAPPAAVPWTSSVLAPPYGQMHYNIAPKPSYGQYRPPAPAPVFSSLGPHSYQPIQPHHPIDLTQDEEDRFDPDAEIRAESRKFGAPDPYQYMDPTQANANIKSLLEGAFDDDEEKPQTRLRKRVKKAATEDQKADEKGLAAKLAALKVEEDKAEEKQVDTKADDEEEDEEDGTVEGLKVKLLPHQVEGVAWMIEKEIGKKKRKGVLPYGGILADDMGLGKTVQSVALILTNPRPGFDAKPEHPQHKLPTAEYGKGTLVVAPLALIKQWEEEIKTKVTHDHALRVLVHHGPNRTKSASSLKKYDVVVTTYQTLTSEHAASNMESDDGVRVGCMGVKWYRIILDEAHSIKNRSAKSTQACYALESWYRWCLTGTPMQNNLDELQSLIRFLRIKPYCEMANWKQAIMQPMKNNRGTLAMKRLQIFLRAFMKRRTKDILKKEGALNFSGEKKEGMKIVKREVLTVECAFDDSEREFYSKMENRADERLKQMQSDKQNDYIGALVLLLRLRQACDHFWLVGNAVDKEQEAIGATEKGGVDDLVAMMGKVSVEAKTCDVCQVYLSGNELREGVARCHDCTADIAMMDAKKQKDKASKDEEVSEDEYEVEAAKVNKSDEKVEPSTKIRHLLRILHSETPEHKTIVFSQFTTMLDLVEPHLRAAKLRYVRYDGSMRNDAREAALSSLRNDPRTRVLLCSLKCGSLGLNLTAASRVVIIEPFWNPFVEEQAIDRVHRLNQTVDVKVFRLTVPNSVEERIMALQERKRELAKAAIEGAGNKVAKLTMQEILGLFRHDSVEDEVDHEKFKAGPGLLPGKVVAAPQSRVASTDSARQEHEVYGRRW